MKKNIIFVEDRSYGITAADGFLRRIPDVNILFTGGNLDQVQAFLKTYRPPKDEKVVIVTCGTFDSSPSPVGNGFDMTASWLADLYKNLKHKGQLDQFDFKNITIVANPVFENRLEDNFIPFYLLNQTCQQLGVPLIKHPKMMGAESMVAQIQQVWREGGTSPQMKR